VLFVRVCVCVCVCVCFCVCVCGLCSLVCVCFGKPAGACAMNVVVGVEFHLLKLLFGTLTLSCVAMFAWLLSQTVLTGGDAVVCVFGFGLRVYVLSFCDGDTWFNCVGWVLVAADSLSLRNTRWTLQTVSGALPAARFCVRRFCVVLCLVVLCF